MSDAYTTVWEAESEVAEIMAREAEGFLQDIIAGAVAEQPDPPSVLLARVREGAGMYIGSMSDAVFEMQLIAGRCYAAGASEASGEDRSDWPSDVVDAHVAAVVMDAERQVHDEVTKATLASYEVEPGQLPTVLVQRAGLSIEELAERLERAVRGEIRRVADVGANLVTTRLASYGFLDEAVRLGVTRYRVTEELDEHTCPVCHAMHGRVFDARTAHGRVDRAVRTLDVQELRVVAPWPKKTPEAVAALRGATSAELAQLGYDTPPYHPLCRGLLRRVR